MTLSGALSANQVLLGEFQGSLTRTDDVVTDIDGTGPFTPSHPVTVGGTALSRSFTYTLPDDPTLGFGPLIAWVDLNGDGKLDITTEPARLPVKVIDGSPRTIITWGSAGPLGGDKRQYDFLAGDGLGNNWGLSVVGADHFDFTFQ